MYVKVTYADMESELKMIRLVRGERESSGTDLSKQRIPLDIFIKVGVSPRATLALEQCSRLYTWMYGRDEVTPRDVKSVIHDVFRHRLVLSENALLNNTTNDDVIDLILSQVPTPRSLDGMETESQDKERGKND